MYIGNLKSRLTARVLQNGRPSKAPNGTNTCHESGSRTQNLDVIAHGALANRATLLVKEYLLAQIIFYGGGGTNNFNSILLLSIRMEELNKINKIFIFN